MTAADVPCAAVAGAFAFAAAWVPTAGSHRHARRPPASRLAQAVARLPPLVAMAERDRLRARRTSAARDMPTFLDIVVLGISAGLSFDASLELYCRRYETPLAQMVSDAMLSWRMGASGRGEALEGLADEVGTPAMERFAATVTEALAFGTPLAEALERQAQVIRDEQRAQVEEEIERVPVKMLIPLGTLIVPAMLLAILGPLLGPALGMA